MKNKIEKDIIEEEIREKENKQLKFIPYKLYRKH